MFKVADIGIGERVCRRSHDPQIVSLINGDIRPPVHRNDLVVVVVDPDTHKEKTGIFRKKELHLVSHGILTAHLIHPQHRCSLVGACPCRKHGTAGAGMVSPGTDVPLHAPGAPGVADGEIAGFDHRIFGQQIPLFLLVIQGPEPAPQIRDEGGFKIIVLKHRCFPHLRAHFGVVAVLKFGRQCIGPQTVTDKESGFVAGIIVQIEAESIPHGGHGGLPGKIHTGDDFFFKTQFCHFITLQI